MNCTYLVNEETQIQGGEPSDLGVTRKIPSAGSTKDQQSLQNRTSIHHPITGGNDTHNVPFTPSKQKTVSYHDSACLSTLDSSPCSDVSTTTCYQQEDNVTYTSRNHSSLHAKGDEMVHINGPVSCEDHSRNIECSGYSTNSSEELLTASASVPQPLLDASVQSITTLISVDTNGKYSIHTL